MIEKPDQIRYLSEILGIRCEPGFELAGCVDILSRDPDRCKNLQPLIAPLALELNFVTETQISEWNEVQEATLRGLELMSESPTGESIAPTKECEVIRHLEELVRFQEWLKGFRQ